MWKFMELLNQNIAILLVMLAGALSVVRHIGIFRQEDMRVFNVFLFRFTLPFSVILGLGVKTDLLSGEIWRFVGAFLMLRGITLLACALLFGGLLRASLGEVTANWLSTTWISTVILGVPLLRALLGPKYAQLGVVAGISSFIFQLPLMLILFEVHTWREENRRRLLPATAAGAAAAAGGCGAGGAPPNGDQSVLLTDSYEVTAEEALQHQQKRGGSSNNNQPSVKEEAAGARLQEPPPAFSSHENAPSSRPAVLSAADAGTAGASAHRLSGHRRSSLSDFGHRAVGCLGFRITPKQARRLGLRLLKNHVLWAVFIGLVLSLSTLGPKYLDPGTLPSSPNCTFAVGAGFIWILLEYFARCTEPVAFFATGMWMVRRNPIACGWPKAAAYMLAKLVLVPALMVGCCFAVGLEGANARAAVLIATLPVSAAAFALSKTYGVGEDIAVANVFLGNLLVLPTTISWMEFMDAVGLFLAPPFKTPTATCT